MGVFHLDRKKPKERVFTNRNWSEKWNTFRGVPLFVLKEMIAVKSRYYLLFHSIPLPLDEIRCNSKFKEKL